MPYASLGQGPARPEWVDAPYTGDKNDECAKLGTIRPSSALEAAIERLEKQNSELWQELGALSAIYGRLFSSADLAPTPAPDTPDRPGGMIGRLDNALNIHAAGVAHLAKLNKQLSELI